MRCGGRPACVRWWPDWESRGGGGSGGIAIGAFAPLASFAMFHMVTVFPLSWVFLYTSESPTHFLILEAFAAVAGLLAIMASGWAADRFGQGDGLIQITGRSNHAQMRDRLRERLGTHADPGVAHRDAQAHLFVVV